MKSERFFFNAAVCRHLLRRFWPLWVCWLLALILSFPALLPVRLTGYEGVEEAAYYMAFFVLNNVTVQLFMSFAAAVLTAMCLFGYLYTTRSCGLMSSLPLRRETLFGTAWLTGLVTMLLMQVLAMLLAVPSVLRAGLPFTLLLQWLAAAALSFTAFYGVAVFCAMLTGNLFVLPAVYVVLSLAVWVFESCVRSVLQTFVYGLSYASLRFAWLSPPVYLIEHLRAVSRTAADGSRIAVLTGLDKLALYAAAGLLLSGLALLLYRRRRMETASDVVAIPALKPVFSYCMGFGAAFAFGALVFSRLISPRTLGASSALLQLGLVLIGAFLGFYLAEMLVHKTLAVFPGNWKGFALICAVLLLVCGAAEFDLFGFERRVPAAEEICGVTFTGSNELRDEESIAMARQLQQACIEHKADNESLRSHRFDFWLSYRLRDGTTFERIYPINFEEAELDDPESCIGRFILLENCAEARLSRLQSEIPVTADTIQFAEISYNTISPEGFHESQSIRLTPELAAAFYHDCLLPDARDGYEGYNDRFWFDQLSLLPESSNVYVSLQLFDRERFEREGMEVYDYISVALRMDSPRCMQWLREHYDFEIISERELQRRAAVDAQADAPGYGHG